jgi:hypothetical protein
VREPAARAAAAFAGRRDRGYATGMAGGPFAHEVVCFECLDAGQMVRAVRVYEGAEDDHYLCDQGHQFGIDWSRGAPDKPQWPPPPEIEAMSKP